jgi:hypothetical protein
MKKIITVWAVFISHFCFSQEMDIFQSDFIYQKNKIAERTMYRTNGGYLQKEMFTYYNTKGQKTKQYWYWNGDTVFNNVESFYYSNLNLLTSLVDSFADGGIEKTAFFYKGKNLINRVTIKQNNDTCYFRYYPNKKTEIKRWYMEGKAYRYDTTVFEKENVKLNYYGKQCTTGNDCYSWRYEFRNIFDRKGNLIQVWPLVIVPNISFARYIYDKRGLLIKKQEFDIINAKAELRTEYYFVYE